MFYIRLTNTNWPNIFVEQGQFSDPDFICDTHQRENVQFADKNNVCYPLLTGILKDFDKFITVILTNIEI